ncbi:hypothetical protein ACVBEF_14630, partial [Glaciimonas sp. GG7]
PLLYQKVGDYLDQSKANTLPDLAVGVLTIAAGKVAGRMPVVQTGAAGKKIAANKDTTPISNAGVDGEMVGHRPVDRFSFNNGRTQNASEINLLHGEYSNVAPYKVGTKVIDTTYKPGTRLYMIVDKDGRVAVWGSPQPIISSLDARTTYARTTYAITPQFKPDIPLPNGGTGLYIMEVEVVKSLPTRVGIVGDQTYKGITYAGGGSQVEFLVPADQRTNYLKPLGSPSLLK